MVRQVLLELALCVGFAVVSCGVTLCDGGTVVRHRQYGDALSEWRVVSAVDFTETSAKACARSLITGHPRSLLDVQYFSDRALSMYLIQPTSGGLPLWKFHRGLALRRTWDIASVTATPKGSVLRFRLGGKVGKQVLSGDDPTVVTIDDSRYDIAWIAFSDSGLYPLQVFLTADRPLGLESGRKLLQHLLLMLPEKPVRVVVRNDYWFTEEPNFPVFYPFATEELAPAMKDSLTQGPQMECTASRGQQDCRLVRDRR